MSSSVHDMSPNASSWDHHHRFTAQQDLLLEDEVPYLLATQDTPQGYLQQRHPGAQHLINGSLSRYNSHASNQYDSASAYQQPSPSFAASPNVTSNPIQSLNPVSTTFTFTPSDYNANSTRPEYQTVFQSRMNASSAPGTHNQLSATSGTPSGPGFPMQFPYTHQPPIRQSEIQSQIIDSMHATMTQQSKRHRGADDSHHPRTVIPDPQELPESANRPRPTGACARCKSLKVRCDFRGNNDTCKRCTGAGQECVIPGRKPRRTPPKREHLLNQIREQAAQIQELMAQLDVTNRQVATASLSSPSTTTIPISPSSSIDLHSPTLDPHTPADSAPPKPEVQDWLAKARASIDTFGGLIALGGTTHAMLVDEDPEKFDSDEEEYGFDFEDDDTDDEGDGYATAEEGGRSRRSQSRERHSPTALAKKKELADKKSGMLPHADSPFGLMAHMANRARGKSAEPEPQDAVGVANADFFRPSPAPDPVRSNPSTSGQHLPHILTREIVTLEDVENLFKLYFDKMNSSTSLMDPVLHTPQYVVMRSPFLFTVVCAVASRFYTQRPGLYTEVMRYAQLAAGTALITGPKNEEMCLAYLLLQLYPVPSRRWEEDRSWVYLGVAIRLAQDLNLNRPTTTTPLNELHARVLLNRTRVWINCFNLDRSTGSQYGKAPIIPNSDYIANHLQDWWCSSKYNVEDFDIHLCIYSMELNIGAKFMEKIRSDPNHPTGLNKSANFTQIASETDDELARVGAHWFHQLDGIEPKSAMFIFRTGLLKMVFSYARLVVLSSGLQHAKEDHLDENSFLMRCFTRASDVIKAFVHRLYTTEEEILLRHAPDAQYVFVTFAGAFLVKLLQLKYAQYFTYEQRVEIRELVQKTVDLLGAADVALDEKHGPSLYSRFLAGLLASPAVRVDLTPTSGKSPLISPGTHKRARKPKIAHAKTLGGLAADISTSVDYPSPSSVNSGSPSPSYMYPGAESFSGAQLQDHTTSLFHGPLPMVLDADLLESAQIMADPLWQDTLVPGFQWMNQMSYNTSVTQDYSMYEPRFGSMT
ncbi:hypothetical protein EV702DRAFT_126760 [Suillus placidus]|uniref:Zn(2)-C6 fungal-type domain-containing protein n=1 Tax=Suillus placidus TaxID=48579 RepID=A0A9P6ZZX4_9AGAM|nr:hypothetical protein EV702DRAFT_126760 [Suillus placidus]